MKKFLATIFAATMLFAFAACGTNAEAGAKIDLADGTYTAQIGAATAERIGHGWADTLTLTVAKGLVTEVIVDSIDADGNKKSENADYPMDIKPSEWMPQLAEQVKNAGSVDEIAGVAGATLTSGNVRALYSEILANGVAGETISLELEVTYTAQVDRASADATAYGWQDTLVVTYLGGEIVAVDFESYDADGNKKSESEDYKMEPAPAVWMPELEDQIKGAQTSDDIAGISGATMASETARILFTAIQEKGIANGVVEVSLVDADPAPDASSAAA